MLPQQQLMCGACHLCDGVECGGVCFQPSVEEGLFWPGLVAVRLQRSAHRLAHGWHLTAAGGVGLTAAGGVWQQPAPLHVGR